MRSIISHILSLARRSLAKTAALALFLPQCASPLYAQTESITLDRNGKILAPAVISVPAGITLDLSAGGTITLPSNAVPASRTVNTHALTGNITLTLPDIITLPADATQFLNGAGAFSTPAGGGGGSISIVGTGWISATGDDGTAVVGDPSHPFATATAAYASGSYVLIIETGTNATLDWDGDVSVIVIGYGSVASSLTVTAPGFNVTIWGNGESMIALQVSTAGEDGTGISGGNITISHATVTSADAAGGNGAAGTNGVAGDDSSPPDSLNGADGTSGISGGNGGTITFDHCMVTNYSVNGGGGGYAGGGGSAFDDGSTPANGGNGGSGGDGGNAGNVNAVYSTLSGGNLSPGNGGADGLGGIGVEGGSNGAGDNALTEPNGSYGSAAIDFSTIGDDYTSVTYLFRGCIYSGTFSDNLP